MPSHVHVLGRRYCHGDLPECNLHVFGALSDVTGNEEETQLKLKIKIHVLVSGRII